ncbi:MAG TPA: single-stranded DNA-binding protein [Acidobacteriota bacterium]|nr:single-stranded DNA-binding protein [Acidobacteriota bacterium]
MARSVNKVILIGNLGRDPEVRYTTGGTPVANFSIATSEQWKNADGEQQEHTEWHNLVAFRRLAEICSEYLRKGSRIYVEGKIRSRSWDGKDGQKHYRTEVIIDDMMMLDSRGEPGKAAGGDTGGFQPDEISDDDIPF